MKLTDFNADLTGSVARPEASARNIGQVAIAAEQMRNDKVDSQVPGSSSCSEASCHRSRYGITVAPDGVVPFLASVRHSKDSQFGTLFSRY